MKNEEFNIESFLNPEKIYIPINSKTNLVKNINEEVFKCEKLNKTGENIYSPISGIITNISDNYIEITNDYKEHLKKKFKSKKSIFDIDSIDAIKLISKYSYIDLVSNYGYLVISLIDKDKFEITSRYLINNFVIKILDTVDYLSQIMGIDHTYIVMKNNDESIINTINNNIGTYPNIEVKMISDTYAIGYPEVMLPKIIHKKISSGECLFLDLNDILSIYNALRNEKPSIERYISVITKDVSKVVNVKIGTKIKDIRSLFNLGDELNVVNGLMSGTEVNENEIVSNKTRSIFFVNEDASKEKKCINCGMCQRVCPVGLNPKYIKNHKNADKSKCIKCGVCTFICPAKINFKPYLGENDE